MRKTILYFGQIIGAVSGVGACGSWIFAMWNPTPALPLSGVAFVVALLMTMLAIITVAASIHRRGITLIVLFFASYFPIGLFLLGIPGWVWVIGAFNMGYLVAGLMIWRTTREVKPSGSSGAEHLVQPDE